MNALPSNKIGETNGVDRNGVPCHKALVATRPVARIVVTVALYSALCAAAAIILFAL